MGSACVKSKEAADNGHQHKLKQCGDQQCCPEKPHIHVSTVNSNCKCKGKKYERPCNCAGCELQECLPSAEPSKVSALAASRLRSVMQQLDGGKVLSLEDMRQEISYTVDMLDLAGSAPARDFRASSAALSDIDEDIETSLYSDEVHEEVREWIATTFARSATTVHRKSVVRLHTFRGVIHAVKASLYVNRLYKSVADRSMLNIPKAVKDYFKFLDNWTFDVFSFHDVTDGQPLRYLGFELFTRHDLLSKFKINIGSLDRFLQEVEEGYKKHKNPYHNESHAADVVHTVNYFLSRVGLQKYLNDLEIFAFLLSAMIHDVEHTGTTNAFHVNSRSDLAVLYNDRSVLENHHVSCAFKIMQKAETDILSNLAAEQYRELRTLVVDMVLATDMSSHFEQLRLMRVALTMGGSGIEKDKALQLILHASDISNPTKDWEVHRKWTDRIMEEFFCQGDTEILHGLPVSPLCDRAVTLIPESQLGFIEFIVSPTYEVCSELLETILESKVTPAFIDQTDNTDSDGKDRAWAEPLAENRKRWKDQCLTSPKDFGAERAASALSIVSTQHPDISDGLPPGAEAAKEVNHRTSRALLTPILS